MNDTEQLIKEALGRLAERTPHPGPTLNALRRKRKRQRNNIFLIATAGVAAVAVLVFGGLIASDRYAPPMPNDAAAALVPVGSGEVSLKYAPHWLPEGFGETSRTTNNAVTRVWSVADGKASVVLTALGGMPGTAGWDEVTVRGLKAWARVADGAASVVWKAQDALDVSVRGVDDVRAVALRVAESVRADAKATHRAPFKVEGEYADQMSGVAPDRWDASLNLGSATVHVATQKPELAAAEPVSVRGREGLRSGATVAVSDGERWIWATSSAYSDRLVELVNDVELVGKPDTGWIGKGL
ncbi:hypothetical protein GCM10011609_19080 [Lentzea pudingi]|uniref:DUF4367 domain-containing protein n=1 Tax=Lentzea pudingi TaxID=1789439 RepID=A0ABQ2HKX4_9PSEU|nr:hypothetical protein [Lentzea pudingi]GGM83336.1 hypothetical protein GCM10011609_19080 [Lentzea pudingi]